MLLTENILVFIGYMHSDVCVGDIILYWEMALVKQLLQVAVCDVVPYTNTVKRVGKRRQSQHNEKYSRPSGSQVTSSGF